MLENLKTISWEVYAQPGWNKPGAIVDALHGVASATDEASSTASYHALLFAVGNNHGGSYYPVLLEIVPFLGQILKEGDPWPKTTVLNALCDLLASFYPEPGFEEVEDMDGRKIRVESVFRGKVRDLRPVIEHGSTVNDIYASPAKELLVLLDENPSW